MRYFITLLLIVPMLTGFCQNNFDYKNDFKKLLTQSADIKSDYYYASLLRRYEHNDSTLSHKEMLALMIGFTQAKEYLPYAFINSEDHIKELISEKKFEQAIDSCNKILRSYPLNFTALMEKGFAYMKLGKDSASYHRDRFMKVLRAIKFSGNGSKQHPYFVLGPTDGQTLITHVWGGNIGTMSSGSDDNGYFLDILEMLKENEEAALIYFNIDHATKNEIDVQLEAAVKKMKEEQDKLIKEAEKK